MGKKVNKPIKKAKLTRSSSIEKTINEGKDYVSRADRRSKSVKRDARDQKLEVSKIKSKVAKQKVSKKPTQQRKRAVSNLPVKKAKKSKPAPITTAVSSVPVHVPAPVVTTAPVRTASRNVSRSGSRNVARTSSKNSQVI
jgi:hypothetical protein